MEIVACYIGVWVWKRREEDTRILELLPEDLDGGGSWRSNVFAFDYLNYATRHSSFNDFLEWVKYLES